MVDPEFRSIVPSLRTQAINDTTDRKNVGISMNITPNSASNVPMVSLKSTDPKIRTKANFRSEERRVGKECRSRWWAVTVNKKQD